MRTERQYQAALRRRELGLKIATVVDWILFYVVTAYCSIGMFNGLWPY